MGLFVPKPSLEPGERIVFKPAANRSQGNRAVGGRLFVTDRRVIFVPNVFDRLTRARPWSCAHVEVEEVGRAERTHELPLSGGVRRRLKLSLSDNRQELFVVNHVESVIENLRDAISSHPDADEGVS